MLKWTKISAIVFLLGALIARWAPSSALTALEDLGFLGLLVSGAYYGYRFLRWIKRRLLWKVRNKIIVSYAFVGIIPVLILAFIGWLAIRLVFGQLSALYLDDELESIAEALHELNQRTILKFYELQTPDEIALRSLQQQTDSSFLPKVSGKLLNPESSSLPEDSEIRAMIHEGFHGLVSDRNQLWFKSILPVNIQRRLYFSTFELPMDKSLIDRIEQKTGLRLASWQIPAGSKLDPSREDIDLAFWDFFSGQDRWSTVLWIHPLQSLNWNTRTDQTAHGVVLSVPLQTLYDHYFRQTSGLGPYVLHLIAILGIVFAVVEGASFLIGVAIARTITRSIHQLHSGTENLQRGHFDYRIPEEGRDQLDALARAFNDMAASIVGLMSEISEREWLEKELEIAREVQSKLFPEKAPFLEGYQLSGTCLPARRVSGDYYDFIPRGSTYLNIVIADISGKGISAALLMASLQSLVRTQILRQSGEEAQQIAEAVAQINEQLYERTAADKFATLVISCIDVEKRELTYSNAGHNPPLFFSNGVVRKLSKGGLVAGLFENRLYEQETLELQQGDVAIFYTDGVVESENEKGEQFGEQRLVQVVESNLFLTAEDLKSLIFDQVSDWVGDRHQSDDITVVVLKVGKQTESR